GGAVAAAARTSGRWSAEAGAGSAESTAPRAWTAKAAGSRRPRPTEAAAWARTAKAATRRTRPGRPIFPRARFAHGEVAPHERLCVELFDDLVRDGAFDELDERESA